MVHISRLGGVLATMVMAAGLAAVIAVSMPRPPVASEVPGAPSQTDLAAAFSQPTGTGLVEGTSSAAPGHTAADVATSLTPTMDTELEQSNQFWNRWVDPPRLFQFDAESLPDLTRQADLIVRGRVTDVYVGEYWRMKTREDLFPLAYLRVEISEVLKGEPVSRQTGSVEIQLGEATPEDVASYRTRLPPEENLWFLMYAPNFEDRSLEPERSAEIAPFVYIRFNHYQGVLRNIGGVVRVMRPDYIAAYGGPEYFPLRIDGIEFEQVIDQVRSAAGSTPRPSPTAP